VSASHSRPPPWTGDNLKLWFDSAGCHAIKTGRVWLRNEVFCHERDVWKPRRLNHHCRCWCSVAGTGTEEERGTWIITVGWMVLYGIHILTLTMYILFLVLAYCLVIFWRAFWVLHSDKTTGIMNSAHDWFRFQNVVFLEHLGFLCFHFMVNFLSNPLTSYVKCEVWSSFCCYDQL